METLIIQVDCRTNNHEGPPQLGITVEAPRLQQRSMQHSRKQQATKDIQRQHDYQNLSIFDDDYHNGSRIGKQANSHKNLNSTGLKSAISHNNKPISASLSEQIQEGLQITHIQEGSVIDRNGQFKIGDIIVEVNGVNLQRPFTESQRTLKQFVLGHTSQGPLILKVLRKPESSSSSILSATGSQSTVVERSTYNSTREPTSSVSSSVRNNSTTNSTNPKSSSIKTSSSSRHLVGALNTRRIGTKHNILLRKGQNGFGIKIAERDNMFGRKDKPIYITAITTNGSAHEDGRLQEGDMLLEVNGIDITGKSQPEVTRMLKNVGINEVVEFVVSRQENVEEPEEQHDKENCESSARSLTQEDSEKNKSLIDLDVPEQDDSVFLETNNQRFEEKIDSILNVPGIDGPGIYVYDIPLNDTKSAGLGLYWKCPIRSKDRKDLGIWIEKVITGGAAWKDGRLQPNDQILAINGISLIGLSEPSDTLIAAVCRGIGPEATPNSIRLNIHRRDPATVAKILQGTNNRIGYSDIYTDSHNRHANQSIDVNNQDVPKDSYQTAPDQPIRTDKSALSITDISASSESSGNQNSHSDSALSPQTQASNSLKISQSCNNDKSENSSSSKANDTSSAISQITDFTNVPVNEDLMLTERSNMLPMNDRMLNGNSTLPKSLQLQENNDDHIDESSTQSWDDDSTDAATGEERFQRDGFGRQSISEKRHAQLMAKNSDTFRRNMKQRDEREKQNQLEEQLARQSLNDASHGQNFKSIADQKPTPISYTPSEFKSIYGLGPIKGANQVDNQGGRVYHREVPVDVHPQPQESRIKGYPPESDFQYDTKATNRKNVPNVDQYYLHQQFSNGNNQSKPHQQLNSCPTCGSTSNCSCANQDQIGPDRQHQMFTANSRYNHLMIKRSNSLESIQESYPNRDGLVVLRAGTVRVARNRRVNDSFRVAVDRSYDCSTNDSSSRYDNQDISSSQLRPIDNNSKVTSSIANYTTSTANEERYLINNGKHQPATTHKKSSSLFTKFLKLGSMKKKKKNRDVQTDPKTATKISTNRDSETAKSPSSAKESSHSRTHSSQSHPNLSNVYNQHNMKQVNNQTTRQLPNNNSKQYTIHSNVNCHDGLTHDQQRSMSMQQQCHHQPIYNTHHNHQVPPMTQPKYIQHVINKPTNSIGPQHQYSYLPPPAPQMHHPIVPQSMMMQQASHLTSQQPISMEQHPYHFVANHSQQRSHIMPFSSITNGQCHTVGGSQWQSPNGLWVASSPLSDQQRNVSQMQQVNDHRVVNHVHELQTSVAHLYPRPQVANIATIPHHPAPFLSPQMMNGHRANGNMQDHRAPLIQDSFVSAQAPKLSNPQPQNIYYYDF